MVGPHTAGRRQTVILERLDDADRQCGRCRRCHRRTRNEQSCTTFYNGLGGGWAWRGFNNSTSTTTVQETPVGTLTVDMFDAKSKQLVWRSIATETLSDKPEKNTKKRDDDFADMFKKFPPKGE
jgi:hypothetical protein